MGLLDIWDRVTAPEKAPEKPQGKWIGEVGPDPIRDKPAPPKVQAINQGGVLEWLVKSACDQISEFVNSNTIPQIFERVEEKMATTNADLQPVIQNAVQVLQQFTAKQAEVMEDMNKTRAELADAKVAIEAQTNKYKATCDERDAALHREQVALQEGDKVKAQLEQLTQVIVNLHLQATNAVNKPAA